MILFAQARAADIFFKLFITFIPICNVQFATKLSKDCNWAFKLCNKGLKLQMYFHWSTRKPYHAPYLGWVVAAYHIPMQFAEFVMREEVNVKICFMGSSPLSHKKIQIIWERNSEVFATCKCWFHFNSGLEQWWLYDTTMSHRPQYTDDMKLTTYVWYYYVVVKSRNFPTHGMCACYVCLTFCVDKRASKSMSYKVAESLQSFHFFYMPIIFLFIREEFCLLVAWRTKADIDESRLIVFSSNLIILLARMECTVS